jgi:DsbC/DsbD-like thiol-disulfide interchange protein
MIPLLLLILPLWTGGPDAGPTDPARPEPVRWTVTVEPAAAAPGAIVAAVVRGEIAEGWRVYAMGSPAGRPLAVQLDGGTALAPLAAPHQVQPKTGYDRHFRSDYAYFEREATVTQVFRVTSGAGPGTVPLEGTVTYMACSDEVCLPPRQQAVRATIRVGAPAR